MPKGIPRFKKVGAQITQTDIGTHGDKTVSITAHMEDDVMVIDAVKELTLPRGWAKGAHLNVRNNGAEYRITLFPEEYDPLHPERCMRFTNSAECQNFVSAWYARESHDPRAR
jgi:hypothetical protein